MTGVLYYHCNIIETKSVIARGSMSRDPESGRSSKHRVFIMERRTMHLTLHGPKNTLATREARVSHHAVSLFHRREGAGSKGRYSPLARPL